MTGGHLPRRREVPSLVSRSDEVHVWKVRLDPGDLREHRAPGRLSADELLRAQRFPFERERRRFTVCRAALRAILGGYLERQPCELTFLHGAHESRDWILERHARLVRFNVSHSHELALVAVSGERELGVDV